MVTQRVFAGDWGYNCNGEPRGGGNPGSYPYHQHPNYLQCEADNQGVCPGRPGYDNTILGVYGGSQYQYYNPANWPSF